MIINDNNIEGKKKKKIMAWSRKKKMGKGEIKVSVGQRICFGMY